MEAAFMMHKDIIVDCSSLSVIRKKGESQTEVTRKQSTPNFPKKNIYYPLIRTSTCGN